MHKLITLLLVGFLGIISSHPLMAAEWQIDSNHSGANFSVRHMTIATVRGHFPDLTGTATFDDQSGGMVALEIKVGAASIDTGVNKRDDHLRSADFLEVSSYPVITFVAKKIHALKDGSGRILGNLTIKGTTREITLDLTGPTETIRDPKGNLRKGATITTTIDRNDFGVSYNSILENGGLLIGNSVKIETDLEFLLPQAAN